MTRTASQDRVFPMARPTGCPFDPPSQYGQLRAEEPIARATQWNGQSVWLVTRYADQREILTDQRFSADPTMPGYPMVSPAQAAVLGKTRSFVFTDDPEHGRYRKMLTKSFMTKRIEAMRPKIQSIVTGLVDDMLAGPKPADLVGSLALPVPSLVICELLGVPYEAHEFFQRNNAILVSRDCAPEDAARARAEIGGYLDELITAKAKDPGDDLLSMMIVEHVRPGRLTFAELSTIGVLLLLAGYEPTANMIGLCVAALLRSPETLAALRTTVDPDVIAGAVEELLRFLHVGQSGIRRVALADIEVGGVLIRAGDGLILLGDSADRDAAVFDDPDRLDIHRANRHHLAFGFGVHQCLGQTLARVELQVVCSTVARHIPTLALAVPFEEIPFRDDMAIYGVHSLRVTW